jgi:hypothetical protein
MNKVKVKSEIGTFRDDMPDTEELETMNNEVVLSSKSLVVNSDASVIEAETCLVLIKKQRVKIKTEFKELNESTLKARQDFCALIHRLDDPLKLAEGIVKQKTSVYQRAEAERIRKEEAERLAKAEKEAEEGQIAEAAELEKAGRKEEAEAKLEAPPEVIPEPPPEPVRQKTAGVSYRAKWTWKLIDINKVPRSFLCLDEKKLNQYAKAMKSDAKVDGVKFYDAGSVAVNAPR